MESISELLKLIKPFNKPIFFIAAGISIRLYAPENIVWYGCVFIVLGIVGIAVKIGEFIWEEFFAYRWLIRELKEKKRKAIIVKYELLKTEERDIVDYCIVNEVHEYFPRNDDEAPLVSSLVKKDFGRFKIDLEWSESIRNNFIFYDDVYSTLLKAKVKKIKAKYDQNKRKK